MPAWDGINGAPSAARESDDELRDTIRRMRELWDSLDADQRAAVLAWPDCVIDGDGDAER